MQCVVCNGNRQKFYKNNLPFEEKYGKFNYTYCEDCGHIGVDESLSDTGLGQDHLKRNIANVDVPEAVLSRVKGIVSRLKEGTGRVYDIGAGNCNFSVAFSRFGFTGIAVDVYRFNENYPHFVEAGQLIEDIRLNGAVALFSNHSFEHIPTEDLKAMMAGVREFVAGGTRCFFVMPCAKVFLAKAGVCLEEFLYGHKNLFTARSAQLFFDGLFPSDKGFQVRVSEINTRWDFMRTRLRILFNYIGHLQLLKSAVLLAYIGKCVLLGCANEVLVEIEHG